MRSPGITLLALIALLAGCRNEAPWSYDSAYVLFGATRDGRVDLRVSGVDGSERTVVALEESEVAPRIAPDGVRIVFHARGDESPYHLWMATPDSAWPFMAEEGVHAIGGVWSPDGNEVAYFSTRGETPGEAGAFPGHVWIRNVATGRDRRVTATPLPGTLGPSDWSADGRWILMARPFDGQLDVVRLDAATGREEQLTDSPGDEYGASFSHDGQRIAFHVDEGEVSHVDLLDLRTGERTRLTSGPARRYSPTWSPDDAWLLVSAMEPGTDQVDLVAVRIEDRRVEPVVATPDDERYGVWLPPESPWADVSAPANGHR